MFVHHHANEFNSIKFVNFACLILNSSEKPRWTRLACWCWHHNERFNDDEKPFSHSPCCSLFYSSPLFLMMIISSRSHDASVQSSKILLNISIIISCIFSFHHDETRRNLSFEMRFAEGAKLSSFSSSLRGTAQKKLILGQQTFAYRDKSDIIFKLLRSKTQSIACIGESIESIRFSSWWCDAWNVRQTPERTNEGRRVYEIFPAIFSALLFVIPLFQRKARKFIISHSISFQSALFPRFVPLFFSPITTRSRAAIAWWCFNNVDDASTSAEEAERAQSETTS